MARYTIGQDGRLINKDTGAEERLDPRAPACAPMVLTTDTLPQPVKSMADGNFYSSKAALRATYRPSGNPQGQSYIEVGNDTSTPIADKPARDPKAIDATLHKALARYQAGERHTPR